MHITLLASLLAVSLVGPTDCWVLGESRSCCESAPFFEVLCPWPCTGVIVSDSSYSPIELATPGWDPSLQSLTYAPCTYFRKTCGQQFGYCVLAMNPSYHNCITSQQPGSGKNCS